MNEPQTPPTDFDLKGELSAVLQGHAYTPQELQDLALDARGLSVEEIESALDRRPPSEHHGWWESPEDFLVTRALLHLRASRTQQEALFKHLAINLPLGANGRPLTLRELMSPDGLRLAKECQETPIGARLLLGLADWLEAPQGAPPHPYLLRAIGVDLWADHWLSVLPARDRKILEMRLGSSDGAKLQHIGRHFGISRERIRQLQVHATKRLCPSYRKETLSHWDRLLFEQLWAALSKDGALHLRDLRSWEQQERGPRMLLIQIRHGDVASLMGRFCVGLPWAWMRERGRAERAMRLAGLLQTELPRTLLPLPVSSLALRMGQEPEAIEEALRFSGVCPYTHGYAHEKRPSARVQRTIDLHRMMCEQPGVVEISSLWYRYKRRYPQDSVRPRDVELVMRDASHLFLPAGAGHWVAVDPALPTKKLRAQAPSSEQMWSAPKAPGTRSQRIEDALAQEGGVASASHLSLTLCEKEGMPRGTLQALISSGAQFLRAAPGVFTTTDHLRSLAPEELHHQSMLNVGSLIPYVQGRRSGLPLGVHPFWSSAMEQRWCLWTQELLDSGEPLPHRMSAALIESLYSLAQPALWPATDEVRSEWEARCVRSTYRYESPSRFQLWECEVNLMHLLVCWLYALQAGHIGWTRASMLSGRRGDDQHTIALLAVGVAAGALEPSGHWQRPHSTTGETATATALFAELQREGTLSWERGAGAALLERLRDGLPDELGWIDRSELGALLDALPEPQATAQGAEPAQPPAAEELNTMVQRYTGDAQPVLLLSLGVADHGALSGQSQVAGLLRQHSERQRYFPANSRVYEGVRAPSYSPRALDTEAARFALRGVESWWRLNAAAYPQATDMLLLADCGEHDSTPSRQWRGQLQRFAQRAGLCVTVLHAPLGAAGFAPPVHRTHLKMHWRGHPLRSYEVTLSVPEQLGAATPCTYHWAEGEFSEHTALARPLLVQELIEYEPTGPLHWRYTVFDE